MSRKSKKNFFKKKKVSLKNGGNMKNNKKNTSNNKKNTSNNKKSNKKNRKKYICLKGKQCGLACIPKKNICRLEQLDDIPSQILDNYYVNFSDINVGNNNNTKCIDSSNCKFGEKCIGSQCVEDEKTYILPW